MGKLMYEINDSVFYIVGEGFFINLDTVDYQGYYDVKGIQSLLLRAIHTGTDTLDLQSALSSLRAYKHLSSYPGDTFIQSGEDWM